MRYQGKIVEWNEERGFGFIEWNGGGDRLFLHISAISDRGRRPVQGDIVSYEVARADDGRQQAARVHYVRAQAAPPLPAAAPAGSPRPAARRSGGPGRLVRNAAILLLAAGGGLMAARHQIPAGGVTAVPEQHRAATGSAAPAWRCEGKTHCTQMSSCAEATYYINHCPGTQMDGDADGIPCEDQLCRP
ncbi:cold-shock protein [Solimonas sp. K1W22B-7]|uniref:cold shock domain-containing protein n=1 Tax=Solimonas sp. K1W22B-7 TaxID=2303331 RepID=UPI000E32DEE6|nr:cold shock domain-containing protein [Solimonas sp. K1W22B-7]AXQ30474.1 cold-shock protein [Solimonas sp. K1W22B-7]